MDTQDAQLEYMYDDLLPALGQAMDVMPGIKWVRMGLPFALDHINLWLIEDAMVVHGRKVEGWTIVDCGIGRDETREHWESIFASALDGKPVLRVIVTHCHPDHVGMADWLCERWQAPLWMTAGEYTFTRMMSAGMPGVDGASLVAHFGRHGLSGETLAKLEERNRYYMQYVPAVPAAFHRMRDGQAIRIGGYDWEVIVGYGHSPEHAALYCGTLGVLVSGDMVLPRISTNVSVTAIAPEDNALEDFLVSLERYLALPEDTIVLPSHGKPFLGMHTRIRQLQSHHKDRLAEVFDACAEPRTATEIVPVMFHRRLDTHQLSFALGEALAHLHKLWYDGQLRRIQGEDGVYRFVQPS